MNIKNLEGVSAKINNIIWASFPYYWAPKTFSGQTLKNKVVFLGNDMKGFMQGMGNDPKLKESYIKKMNECLDYVRRECGPNSEFLYKPHPADFEEQKYLNLRGFTVVNERGNAEIFFWKNSDSIKAVFAVNSLGLLSSYGFGLNSYAFCNLFRPIYGEKIFESIADCYAGMPDGFFINDLGRRLPENKPILKKDEIVETYFRDLLSEYGGNIWFIVSATEFIVILISLANFIRSIYPDRQINLVISRHHRWDIINPADIKPYFNRIIFLPRIFYSLRNILEAFKTFRAVRKIGIRPGDVIISGSQVEFVENCLISRYKNNPRIGLVLKRDFYANYDNRNSVFSNNERFRFTKASFFFNKILEPFLGLNKTLFMLYAPGAISVNRYQRPINELFDRVIVLDIPGRLKIKTADSAV